MKIKVKSILGLALCIVLLAGCNNTEKEKAIINKEVKDRIQIGLSFDSYVIERWQRDRDVFVSTANELGADVNVQTANGSVEEQIEQIEYFIDKKMDVIVIIPADADSLKEVVNKAQNKGIKVIAYDRLIKNANVDLYISFDNEKVGELMAETLTANTPEYGKISVIFGPKTDNNVIMIENGFTEVISKTNRQIVYKDYAKGWLAEEAFLAVNKTLETTDRIDGMLCGNDDLASQAIRALSEHRLAGSVSVVGQDADLIACQRIVEGTQSMTVYKPIEELAKMAAEYAVKLGKGDTVYSTQYESKDSTYEISQSKGDIVNDDDTIFDGTYDVPYVKLEPIAVTKENIDEVIIDGGFHLEEEVYLNVSSEN